MIYQRGQNKSVDIPTFIGYNKTKVQWYEVK